MVAPAKNIPFYTQMIAHVRKAFVVLDEEGRAEVIHFIASQQNSDGGFNDRGGRSDLYYSLFAGMMLKAAKGESEIRNQKSGDRNPLPETRILKQSFQKFLSSQSIGKIPGFIELCSLVLLQKNFKVRRFSKLNSVLAIGKAFWKERSSINLSYRSFVLFLTLDAVLPIRWLFKFAARKILERTIVDLESPCSEVAAKVFLQKMLKHDVTKEQELLTSFVCTEGGFKAFRHVEHADMLSTAVSLFALHLAGSDLRLLKPAGLIFIQENYADGAFLSGDGDATKDLEYTFYGMLALGILAG